MSGLLFDSFGEWVLGVLLRTAQQTLEQLMVAYESTAAVSFTSGWWVAAQAQSILRSVGLLAAALMVGCLLLAAVQGLIAGDPTVALRAALVDAPVSVLGTLLLTAAATLLLNLTDAAAAMVYGADTAGLLLASLGPQLGGPGALKAALLGLFLLAAFLLWVELVIRSSLIYLLVAFAPLLLAARVWPAARAAWQKSLEVGLALIFSKFAIALALGLGVAAGRGGPPGETDLSGLLTRAALLLIAAFTPFALLRLMPAVEAAVGAQGIGRSPGRGVFTAMQAGYYAQGLARLSRGGVPPALAMPDSTPSPPPPPPPPPEDTGNRPALPSGSRPPALPPGRQPPALGPGPRPLGTGPRALGPGPQPSGSSGPPTPSGGPRGSPAGAPGPPPGVPPDSGTPGWHAPQESPPQPPAAGPRAEARTPPATRSTSSAGGPARLSLVAPPTARSGVLARTRT